MRPRLGLLAALLLLAGASFAQDSDYKCRTGPAAQAACGLPYALSNFQGFHECADAVKVGRPSSLDELQALVAIFPRAKASGVGHSWWTESFCAGNSSNAINIVTTEIKPVLEFMASPLSPKQAVRKDGSVAPDFPIKVDEVAETVTVAAGITQRVLLDYLADFKCWKQPAGWTLGAFSWLIDQTIGGAVATGSHGSSMKYGSLSSQLRGLKLVLANGTLLEVTPKSNPHLFNAAGVSVGRLGVISELTLKIMPQMAVERKLQELEFDAFVQQIREAQADYVAAKEAGDVHLTQAFWAVPTASVQRVDYEHKNKEPSDVMLNIAPADEPSVRATSGPEDSAFAQVEKKALAANRQMTVNTRFWSNLYVTQLRSKTASGTFESRKSYLSMSSSETQVTSTFAPYEQWEVAIPFERAGTCLEDVAKEIYGSKLWEGCRTPWLIRFITEEDFYLSPSTDGPVMYINMEDYLSRSTGKPNKEFERSVQLFRERCGARLHWGKAGWPSHAKCFDGSKEYPKTWCHMGCAVQELDPAGKFASEWDGWRWAATRGGASVPFASCCTPRGFSSDCVCAPRATC